MNHQPRMPYSAHLSQQQPRLARPAVNYRPRNGPPNYGYSLPYPVPSNINFEQRPPVFQNVYQHCLEDYQPYCEPNYIDMEYLNYQNQMYSQQEYYQYDQDFSSEVSQFPSNQVNQKTVRFSQRAAPAPNLRHPTASTQKRNASKICSRSGNQAHAANSAVPTKARRLNPPMELLPLPKPDSKKQKGSQSAHPKKQTAQIQQKLQQKPNEEIKSSNEQSSSWKKETPPPQQIQLYGARVLLGSIPQIFKWSSARHKVPPVYETIGTLIERIDVIESHGNHQLENHFRLRNLLQWQRSDGSSTKESLECLLYSTESYRQMFPTESSIRVVGRFLPSGVFHCLKVRRATESDIALLTSKIKGHIVKVNVGHCSRNNTSEEQEQPSNPLVENYQQIQDSLDEHYALFTPF